MYLVLREKGEGESGVNRVLKGTLCVTMELVTVIRVLCLFTMALLLLPPIILELKNFFYCTCQFET